ncbi:MAG: hypothetical protein JWP25_8994 [Bradyrhizobium sp.]|nr:hypothetical protein [Bradyrhizobium sp.]
MTQQLTSAAEVRSLLAQAGFTKKRNPANCQGEWINKAGQIARVGMGLAKSFRTGQSSIGAGAPWVYTVWIP